MKLATVAKTDGLIQAVAAEKLAIAESQALYQNLTAKITQYQTGQGPAPTEAEFNQWLAEVEKAIALRRVLSGVAGV